MANLPIRNLGGAGVISDIHAYDLPPNALSAGVNIRFENRKITRAPVFRRVYQYTSFNPGYVFTIPPDGVVAVAADYSKIYQLVGTTLTDLTPTTVPTGGAGSPFTHTFLGNVAYLNSKTNVPLQKTAAASQFSSLTAWNSTWRCGSLRSFKDFLVAINVTKGASEYPTMVKWSDVAQYGAAPGDWDETSTTNSAGENILNDMKCDLIDGLTLRDTFFLYGEKEVWAMTYIGGNFLFDFRKRFDNTGVISQNCAVEVDGLHYVFDNNDIYVHDGASKRSIVHGTNKDFVFNALIRDLSYLCFVQHDPNLTEIRFCYPSTDRLVGFNNPTTGCNRAAVYNYRNETWSFYDLPNVTGATSALLTSGVTYSSSSPDTYESLGGSYLGDADSSDAHTLFVSRGDSTVGLTASRLYGLDLLSTGRLVKPVETEALKDAFVERIGLDIDEAGDPLTSYKVLHAIYPQIGVFGGDEVVEFQFGAADIVGLEPEWEERQEYDPTEDNKVDTRVAGRYLAHRLYASGTTDFAFSGLDAKIVIRGRR